MSEAEVHNYKFNITMTCGGCSGAIDRTLKKLDGVKSYEVNVKNQTAEVVAEPTLAYETVLEKLKKTGKKVTSGEADGVSKEV